MNKLNILLAASEVVPFAKSGGLADVSGALPKALKTLGHDIRVVMPRYYVVDKQKYKLKLLEGSLSVSMGSMGDLWAAVYEGRLPQSDVPIYFIEHDSFFGRKGLYDEDGKGFSDNDNRFIFFSKAVMQLAKKLHFRPDVIHANDWHTAPIPLLLNTSYAFDPHFKHTGSLLSIHNLEHQGKFYKGAIDVLGVGWEHFTADELEEYDGVNLLKGGIVHADAINAVSKKYAQEIRTSDFGFGLENLINNQEGKLFGILNGVDYDEWSPSVDKLIPYNFDADSLEGKAKCKMQLQKEFNLPQRPEVPLIGFVGRLAEQKGITLIATCIEELLQMEIQVVLLGTGEKWAESFFSEIATKNPEKFACFIGYDNTIAHQIEAASDMFLMPSLFEPCGLNQIYSLRYGTIPIVRATGGLDDTIQNYDANHKSGTGFKFYDATPDALLNTVKWAVDTYYNDKEGIDALRQNAMSKRYEWTKAAEGYEELYRHIISGRLNGSHIEGIMMQYKMRYDVSTLTEMDVYLFKQGSYVKMYEKFGAHTMVYKGKSGVHFAVWAPNAESVCVRGDFNDYEINAHPLQLRKDDSGVWEGFIENIACGLTYKYHIVSKFHNIVHEKSDPFAFYSEEAPKSASRTWNLDSYKWQDEKWMNKRHQCNAHDSPVSVYEIHIGSWRRNVEEGNRYLTYREIADELVPYLKKMHYTHVEFMPLTEYPYFGSWGYQVVGYFSATSRFGEPEDLMFLIDMLHKNDIGVIMDWVPSHFAVDMHGLINFDGTALYEHEDPRQGYHPEWGSIIFNYGRNEVKSFLISSAMFWLEKYHFDGIRVDAVASMLHLDYAREEGEWIPNKHGGNENLEAVDFLRKLNESVYKEFADIMMIAEESTAWPMVTRPTNIGGLGFGFKWNMGWMHDTLKYMSYDPIYRQHHQHQLTFSLWYAFDEHFMLPLSHDEVVHMKGSLINKMPGDEALKFANLRAMYAYMMSHPGKKLLFMGGEIAQYSEWNFESSLDWHMLENPYHSKLQKMLADLNFIYKEERALHQYDEKQIGFEWIDNGDYQHNCISYIRKSDKKEENIYVLCNFSDSSRSQYKVGVPYAGEYEEIFNSQSSYYEGSNIGNTGKISAQQEPMHNREYSLELTLPPLGVIYLKRVSSSV